MTLKGIVDRENIARRDGVTSQVLYPPVKELVVETPKERLRCWWGLSKGVASVCAHGNKAFACGDEPVELASGLLDTCNIRFGNRYRFSVFLSTVADSLCIEDGLTSDRIFFDDVHPHKRKDNGIGGPPNFFGKEYLSCWFHSDLHH